MSTPPGQEPRPGFTPRAAQGRPGSRGDSGRPDDGYRRDDSSPRRPPPGASGRGPGSSSRDTDRDADDYWADGRQSGTRAPGSRGTGADRDRGGVGQQRRDPGYRDAHEQPARRPDDRYRNSRPAGGPGQDGRPSEGRRPSEGWRDRGDRGWGAPTDRRDRRDGYRNGSDDARNAAGRGTGAPTFTSRNGPAATAIRPRSGLLATPVLRWAGAWRQRRAVLVLFGTALLSLVGTIAIGHDPGFLIGILLVIGSVVAAIGVQRTAVHKLIPLPALSYLVTTTLAGMVKDRANLNNSKELATSFLTWIGGGFFGLVAATVLVVLIAFIRWLASRLLVSGQLPAVPSGSGRAAPGPASRDPWTSRTPQGDGPRRDSAPASDRSPRDRAPSGNAFGGSHGPGSSADQSADRSGRDARDDRNPRGDRVPRPDRGPRDGADRGSRESQDSWDGQGQRRSSGPRDAVQRPRATDSGPRDLW